MCEEDAEYQCVSIIYTMQNAGRRSQLAINAVTFYAEETIRLNQLNSYLDMGKQVFQLTERSFGWCKEIESTYRVNFFFYFKLKNLIVKNLVSLIQPRNPFN